MITIRTLTKSMNYRIKLVGQSLLTHKTNSPYLSGDSFARISQLVITESSLKQLSTQVITSRPRIIFIESHIYSSIPSDFFESIDYAHIIILGNSDLNFDIRPMINRNCIAVYCQNAGFPLNSRFKLLPIGLENLKLCGSGFKRYHKYSKRIQNENKILFPPISPTNPDRAILMQQAEARKDLFQIAPTLTNRRHYFSLTKNFKFILVPEGNGHDTHRLWEVLYQGSFPVAQRTKWSENIKSLGIPILLFDDLNELTETVLLNFKLKNKNFHPSKCASLWINYWENEFNHFFETRNENL